MRTANVREWLGMRLPREGMWNEERAQAEPVQTTTFKNLEEGPERTICKEERLVKGGRVLDRVCQAQSDVPEKQEKLRPGCPRWAGS